HGSRHQDLRLLATLCLARRHLGRWRDGGARLLEDAGHADLDRRVDHDGGWCAVAVRPAPARWRTQAGAPLRRRAGGVGPMRRLLLAIALIAAALPAFAVQPDEVLKDPALE